MVLKIPPLAEHTFLMPLARYNVLRIFKLSPNLLLSSLGTPIVADQSHPIKLGEAFLGVPHFKQVRCSLGHPLSPGFIR